MHGLNSSHCLLPHPGAPGCGPGGPPVGQNEYCSDHGLAPPPGAYDRYAYRPPHGSYGPPSHMGAPPPPGSCSALGTGNLNMPQSPAPPGWGTRGSLPPGAMGHMSPPQPQGGRSRDVPHPGDAAGGPLCSGPLASGGMGHMPPQPQCGRNWDTPLPGDAFGYANRPPWQQPSGPSPPGYAGGCGGDYYGSYASPHMPAQPPSMERPCGPDPKALRQRENIGCPPPKGPPGHSMATPVDRLPTPAKARGGAPPTDRSMGATDRSMANGFKDSTDFIDAGFESEAEFLTSRSMPPPKRKQGGRVHRQPDEASCMSCMSCGW